MVKIIHSILFLLFIGFQALGATSSEEGAHPTPQRLLKPFQSVRDAIAFSYYATSVSGRQVDSHQLYSFLETPRLQSLSNSLIKTYTTKIDSLDLELSYISIEDGDINHTSIVPIKWQQMVRKETHDVVFYFPFMTGEEFHADPAACSLNTYKKAIAHFVRELSAQTTHPIFIHTIMDAVNHYSEIEIKITPSQGMRIQTTDPLAKNFFGVAASSPRHTLSLQSFFRDLFQDYTLQIETTHRGDQLFNFHDCGRFSLIYMLYRLEGRDPRTLSSEDIYHKFKALEGAEFEKYNDASPSLFSRLMTPRRWAVDLFFTLVP